MFLNKNSKFSVWFKVYHVQIDDPSLLRLLYAEAKENIIDARYPISQTDCDMLAGIQALIDHTVYLREEHTAEYYRLGHSGPSRCLIICVKWLNHIQKMSDVKRSHGVSVIHTVSVLVCLSNVEGWNVLGLHATLFVNSWLHCRWPKPVQTGKLLRVVRTCWCYLKDHTYINSLITSSITVPHLHVFDLRKNVNVVIYTCMKTKIKY